MRACATDLSALPSMRLYFGPAVANIELQAIKAGINHRPK
jgi:hypothetical protein